ncbi:glucan endo-1,3-beta-glucosidase 4-like isoform X1 [Herrania umbratica]|uniref:Glucan endo-1,3-beta-glucosidase 4-like isoform X1 n=1 Tax=Herrania umbratica TaxID=108875 RepID=A0A6J1B8W4_9ROSI|nr:glucan endo-1,3-beta-glucosidase 4-like isoform X1 [Herrania umbratica]
MAKPSFTLPIFSLFVLFSLLYSGSPLKMANGQKTWCIANPLSSDSELAANIEYVCSQLDCRLIEPDGPCFEPDTQMHHASYVMNLYYQTYGRHRANCDFRRSGVVSLTDPSYGNCTFQSGGALAEQEPSVIWCNNMSTSITSLGKTWHLMIMGLQGNWCVAKPGTSDDLLQQNINFACNQVDCGPTHSGGACFYPTTLVNHASYAMNLYYQTTGRKKSSCDFRETGLLVSNDPSYGNCAYQYSHD